MKTSLLILTVMSCGCLIASSCQKQTVSPRPSALSEVHMTAVDSENAKAKFKASPGMRTKEARMLAPMITVGMTKAQVREMLGNPDKPKSGGLGNTWCYTVARSQFISVTFGKGKVVKTEAVGIE